MREILFRGQTRRLGEKVWMSGFYAKYKDEDGWNFDHLENIEVIGNIHDNPELLKGE
jgi:hypothetical protein